MSKQNIQAKNLSSSDPTLELLTLINIKFRWKKNLPLVIDLKDLSISKGQKIFIKGSSGSGKTTLLNLIAGVITPEVGTVSIENTALSKLSAANRDRFRADNIGFIFQMFNLIPYLSVLENVTLSLKFSKERQKRLEHAPDEEARNILQGLGLTNDQIRRKVTELSIGQQQRVAAARAIVGNPPLLIADEPTSALDSDTRESFIKLLFEACDSNNMTLLFVSHDGALENLFDKSIALKEINKVSQ